MTPCGRSTMAALASVAVYSCMVLCLMSDAVAAQLRVGFYSQTCPTAETLIRQTFNDAVQQTDDIGADLLRMHFHDCFVRGCDGSVLIASANGNTAEKDAEVNQTIEEEAFQVVDNAKARLEAACPGVVSCADILAFFARDSVAHYGGHFYDLPAGRRDGRISRASESMSELPSPNLRLGQLTKVFAGKGLTQYEMITLSGAHTIGVAHCPAFTSRLYNFSSSSGVDPTLDPAYAAQLQQQCPTAESNTEVPMDPPSELGFDNSYYQLILRHRGLFTSDQTLVSKPAAAAQVTLFALNSAVFKSKFSAAMVRMGSIGVLTGTHGEIRTNCRVPNSIELGLSSFI
ncbi:peroxidase 5-like [Curcuma longa]|uniref:peroxidase 5-like n=1 Tax=Curcuma longa TaxID=136217 RepID=UPI003D9F1904